MEENKQEQIDWENKYLYLLAEFDNYKKRKAKEEIKNSEYKYKDIFKQLLPILDIMSMSFKMEETVPQGIIIVFNELMNVLEKEGLKQIVYPEGKLFFDEETMYAVSALQNIPNMEDNEVIDISKLGYKYKDEILRYTQVVVNKIVK